MIGQKSLFIIKNNNDDTRRIKKSNRLSAPTTGEIDCRQIKVDP